MGQAVTMMKYDRAANERNAVAALHLASYSLSWHRLDDGVMGGQSETTHCTSSDGKLVFKGTINSNGGGFASIRTPIPDGVFTKYTTGIKLRYKGDGKTYKFILNDGNRSAGGPFGRSPSWQVDLPTVADEWRETILSFKDLLPSFGGGTRNRSFEQGKTNYRFDATEMRQMGLMLSLRRSNGDANPIETFGEGVFPFRLEVASIEPVKKEVKEQKDL